MSGALSTLRYSTTIEDLVAFNRFHNLHSPRLIRQRRLVTVILPVAALIGVSVMAILTRDLWSFLFPFLFIIFYGAFLRRAYGKAFDKKVRRLYSEGKNSAALGAHRLSIREDGLTSETEVSSSTISFKGIEKIESSPTHIFIYISAISAMVIPKAGVTEGDYEDFLAQLRAKWEAMRG
jgi:YcxB-like protein